MKVFMSKKGLLWPYECGDVLFNPGKARNGEKEYFYILKGVGTPPDYIDASWTCLVARCDKNDKITYEIEEHLTPFLSDMRYVENVKVFDKVETESKKIFEEEKKKQEGLRLGGVDRAIEVLWKDGFGPNEIAELLSISERHAVDSISRILREKRNEK